MPISKGITRLNNAPNVEVKNTPPVCRPMSPWRSAILFMAPVSIALLGIALCWMTDGERYQTQSQVVFLPAAQHWLEDSIQGETSRNLLGALDQKTLFETPLSQTVYEQYTTQVKAQGGKPLPASKIQIQWKANEQTGTVTAKISGQDAKTVTQIAKIASDTVMERYKAYPEKMRQYLQRTQHHISLQWTSEEGRFLAASPQLEDLNNTFDQWLSLQGEVDKQKGQQQLLLAQLNVPSIDALRHPTPGTLSDPTSQQIIASATPEGHEGALAQLAVAEAAHPKTMAVATPMTLWSPSQAQMAQEALAIEEVKSSLNQKASESYGQYLNQWQRLHRDEPRLAEDAKRFLDTKAVWAKSLSSMAIQEQKFAYLPHRYTQWVRQLTPGRVENTFFHRVDVWGLLMFGLLLGVLFAWSGPHGGKSQDGRRSKVKGQIETPPALSGTKMKATLGTTVPLMVSPGIPVPYQGGANQQKGLIPQWIQWIETSMQDAGKALLSWIEAPLSHWAESRNVELTRDSAQDPALCKQPKRKKAEIEKVIPFADLERHIPQWDVAELESSRPSAEQPVVLERIPQPKIQPQHQRERSTRRGKGTASISIPTQPQLVSVGHNPNAQLVTSKIDAEKHEPKASNDAISSKAPSIQETVWVDRQWYTALQHNPDILLPEEFWSQGNGRYMVPILEEASIPTQGVLMVGGPVRHAVALAKALIEEKGLRVCLIDCDMDLAPLDAYFPTAANGRPEGQAPSYFCSRTNLRRVALAPHALSMVLKEIELSQEQSPLFVIPARHRRTDGTLTPLAEDETPLDLAQSAGWPVLLKRLTQQVDVVILSVPMQRAHKQGLRLVRQTPLQGLLLIQSAAKPWLKLTHTAHNPFEGFPVPWVRMAEVFTKNSASKSSTSVPSAASEIRTALVKRS